MSTAYDRIDLRWSHFAARMFAGAVWLLSSAAFVMAANARGSETLFALRAVCAAGVALAPLVWALSLQRRMARADELERKIISESLGAGAVFALTWGALMAAFALIYPAQSEGYRQSMMALLLAESPSLAMLISEVGAQIRRRALSKTE